MPEKTQLQKAVAFEAIRGRIPDAWTLLEIVESANPPDYHDDPHFPGSPAWCDISFAARDGWQVTIFYDGGELDNIAEIRSPDGLRIDPWAWPDGAPGGNILRNWAGVGDVARLRACVAERPIRTIDCTAFQGAVEVTEEERDDIVVGQAELVGGYLDWDASVIRRTPAEG